MMSIDYESKYESISLPGCNVTISLSVVQSESFFKFLEQKIFIFVFLYIQARVEMGPRINP